MRSIRSNLVKITLMLLAVSTLDGFAQSDSDARPPRRAARPEGDQPQPERQFQPPGGGQFRPQAGVMGGLAGLQVMRVLTEEQRQSMRDALQDQREKMQPIEQQLREARKDILAAGLGEKFDETAVREKALKIAKLEAELTVLRAKALSHIKPPLSAEQIEQIKSAPAPEFGQGRAQGRAELRGSNPDQPRGEANRSSAPRGQRRQGERDENDLPPKPKADL